MSLLINGIDLPSSCQPCKLKRFAGNRVLSGCKPEVLYECPFCDGLFALKNKRQPSCKFEQLPTPHGRLIDADRLLAIIKSAAGDQISVPLQAVLDSIEHAPTVIEAELNKKE